MSKIVGIDLGTTFSAIAELDDLGNPEVLSDPENNNRITRSAVYIGSDKAIVGNKALDAAVTNKKNTILEVKSEMENNVVWSSKEGEWIENEGKKDIKGYVPSQISSIILSKLKDYTSGVKKAVVTVPAMFAEAARTATIDAAKLAKLDVELINEPTAAVLHYANLPGSSINGRVLIFDLGGGTFDISIASVKGKKVDVITSVGDKHLGGRRFDEEIINIIDKKYKKAKGKGLDNPLKDEKLFTIAERIKKILSNKDKATEIIEGPKGPHKIDISRNEFEDSIDTYVEKIKMLMEQALEEAKCKANNISQTLLVGGSTRIPIISEVITKIMKKAPIKGVNVDEAVACGAAIYAGLQNKESLNPAQKKAISNVELEDVCNHYLGTLMIAIDDERKIGVELNDIVIPRNTKLPCSITKNYQVMSDNQKEIECSVTQSEGEESDPEFVNIIAKETLSLSKNAKGGDPVEVTYSYDTNGAIHCIFEDMKSKKKKEISLKPEGSKNLKDLKENLDFDIE
jgi:molecular chaperone DnaK